MSSPPASPKIYHITHVDNLTRIIEHECLRSDRSILKRGGPIQTIGMSTIKRRRIEQIEVACHPGTKVGDYVPFYFCPRSIMLYVIYRANHDELGYREGQGPILHLEADLDAVVEWARESEVRWAFSRSNAGASYAEFRSRTDDLAELDWEAIAARDFRAPRVKEGKQAEFLVFDRFPFDLVERIGVHSRQVLDKVKAALQSTRYRPAVEIRPDWYY